MGTKDLSFVKLNQLIGRKTGGISVYPLTSSVRGKEDPCSHIIVRGKAMAGRADDLFHLVFFFFRVCKRVIPVFITYGYNLCEDFGVLR
jgi:hypothetical protein